MLCGTVELRMFVGTAMHTDRMPTCRTTSILNCTISTLFDRPTFLRLLNLKFGRRSWRISISGNQQVFVVKSFCESVARASIFAVVIHTDSQWKFHMIYTKSVQWKMVDIHPYAVRPAVMRTNGRYINLEILLQFQRCALSLTCYIL
jgi:hypothetical protein